jgi:hypothetical protein
MGVQVGRFGLNAWFHLKIIVGVLIIHYQCHRSMAPITE